MNEPNLMFWTLDQMFYHLHSSSLSKISTSSDLSLSKIFDAVFSKFKALPNLPSMSNL
jgi:hypothetical protein